MRKLKNLFIILVILALSVTGVYATVSPDLPTPTSTQSVTATPEDTSTPTAGVTPTATTGTSASPSSSASASPSSSASASPSSSASASPSSSASASPSSSASASPSSSADASPSSTATPTPKVTAKPTKWPSIVEPTKDNYNPNRETQAPPTLPPEVTINPDEIATPVPEATPVPTPVPNEKNFNNSPVTGLIILFVVLVLLLAADIFVIIWRKKMGYETMINNGISRRKVRDDLRDYPEDALPSDLEQAIEEAENPEDTGATEE